MDNLFLEAISDKLTSVEANMSKLEHAFAETLESLEKILRSVDYLERCSRTAILQTPERPNPIKVKSDGQPFRWPNTKWFINYLCHGRSVPYLISMIVLSLAFLIFELGVKNTLYFGGDVISSSPSHQLDTIQPKNSEINKRSSRQIGPNKKSHFPSIAPTK